MAVLDSELQSRIDELRFGAAQFYRTDRALYYSMKTEAWDLYPEPKEEWNEAYSLAKDLFQALLRERDYEKAKLWLNRMIACNNNLHLFPGDLEFSIGRYLFEIEQYEPALGYFQIAVKIAGLRYFGNEDPKYREFYKTPDKWMQGLSRRGKVEEALHIDFL